MDAGWNVSGSQVRSTAISLRDMVPIYVQFVAMSQVEMIKES